MLAGVLVILVSPELQVPGLLAGLAVPFIIVGMYWKQQRWALFFTPGRSLVLSGDLMKKGEAPLLALDAAGLRSDVLVAPHHGSNSSSTPEFVAAAHPAEALFPVGYRNRWGFRKSEVEARYMPIAGLADTAMDGALPVHFRAGLSPALVSHWRRDQPALWREP